MQQKKLTMQQFKFIRMCLSALFLIETALAALEAEGIDGGDLDVINPFLVSIQISSFPICGGAIIDENHVLTAAHCVIKLTGEFIDVPYKIKALSVDLNDTESGIIIDVDEIYVLKSYYLLNSKNDIAVLKLKKNLDLSDNSPLKKLSLPPPDFSVTDQIAVFAGYGWNTRLDIFYQMLNYAQSDNKLRFAQAQILSKDECKKYKGTIDDSQFCAKIIERDETLPPGTCIGRTGNPLVIDEMVVGVLEVGWSAECADLKDVFTYTKISIFLPFINNAVNDIVTNDMRVHKCSKNVNWHQIQ